MKCTASDLCQHKAAYVAAQSTDQGETTDWQVICEFHALTWNDGSDWKAPVYPVTLGKRLRHSKTVSTYHVKPGRR